MLQQNDDKTKRPQYPFTGREIFRVIIATFLILLAGYVVVAGITYLGSSDEITEDMTAQQIAEIAQGNLEELPLEIKIATMAVQLSLILPVLYFLRRKRLSARVYLRINPVPLSLIGYACLMGISITIIGDALSRLIGLIMPMPPEMQEGMTRLFEIQSWADFLTIGLTVAVLGPLVEELLFRGFLQRYFEVSRGVTAGVLSASFLFAFYHMNLHTFIPIIIMATVMGAIGWRSESIYPPLVVHIINNTSGVIVYNLMEKEPTWYLLGNQVSPLISITAVVLLVWAVRAFFTKAEAMGLGGNGPSSAGVGTHINTTI